MIVSKTNDRDRAYMLFNFLQTYAPSLICNVKLIGVLVTQKMNIDIKEVNMTNLPEKAFKALFKGHISAKVNYTCKNNTKKRKVSFSLSHLTVNFFICDLPYQLLDLITKNISETYGLENSVLEFNNLVVVYVNTSVFHLLTEIPRKFAHQADRFELKGIINYVKSIAGDVGHVMAYNVDEGGLLRVDDCDDLPTRLQFPELEIVDALYMFFLKTN